MVLITKKTRKPDHWFSYLPPGKAFPELTFRLDDGSKVSSTSIIQGSWQLVFFLADAHQLDWKYVGLLEGRLAADNLHVTVVLSSSAPSTIPHSFFGSTDTYSMDFNEVQSFLRIPLRASASHSFSWTFLIDPEGKINFSLPRVLKPSEMRQLTEAQIYGKVNYQGGYAPTMRPPSTIYLVKIGNEGRIREEEAFVALADARASPFDIIYMPPTCSACAASAAVLLDGLENLAEKRYAESDNFILVFSENFSLAGLDLSSDLIRQHAYQTRGAPLIDEDEYFALSAVVTQPLILRLHDGQITRIPLNSLHASGQAAPFQTRKE